MNNGRNVSKKEFFDHVDCWPRRLTKDVYRGRIGYYDWNGKRYGLDGLVAHHAEFSDPPEHSDFRIVRDEP